MNSDRRGGPVDIEDALDLGGVLVPRTARLSPPPSYVKKIVNAGGDFPLSRSFTRRQVRKRVAFYRELNRRRRLLPRGKTRVEAHLALFGWEDTTTVRVYMRETVSKIAAELFWSRYELSVENVRYGGDRDHGHVELRVRASPSEVGALLDYIRPGASYFVYDGEESRYVAGDTEKSEFIITRAYPEHRPRTFWRRSQSFIAAMEMVS